MSDLLFVDDNPDILEANRSYFEDQGFHATACISGEAAALLLQTHSFDCIVLDVMMPGMDGFETLEEIRKEYSLPILMFTSKNDSISKVRGLRAGADDYLTKPFDMDELIARIASLKMCIRDRRNSARFSAVVISVLSSNPFSWFPS